MERRKLVLYCRSSTKAQIQMQAETLRSYAAKNNCQIVAEVFDRSRSKLFRRLKQRKALCLANRHKAEMALVSVSRISRELSDVEWFSQHLAEKQVSVITPTEGRIDVKPMNLSYTAICKDVLA